MHMQQPTPVIKMESNASSGQQSGYRTPKTNLNQPRLNSTPQQNQIPPYPPPVLAPIQDHQSSTTANPYGLDPKAAYRQSRTEIFMGIHVDPRFNQKMEIATKIADILKELPPIAFRTYKYTIIEDMVLVCLVYNHKLKLPGKTINQKPTFDKIQRHFPFYTRNFESFKRRYQTIKRYQISEETFEQVYQCLQKNIDLADKQFILDNQRKRLVLPSAILNQLQPPQNQYVQELFATPAQPQPPSLPSSQSIQSLNIPKVQQPQQSVQRNEQRHFEESKQELNAKKEYQIEGSKMRGVSLHKFEQRQLPKQEGFQDVQQLVPSTLGLGSSLQTYCRLNPSTSGKKLEFCQKTEHAEAPSKKYDNQLFENITQGAFKKATVKIEDDDKFYQQIASLLDKPMEEIKYDQSMFKDQLDYINFLLQCLN